MKYLDFSIYLLDICRIDYYVLGEDEIESLFEDYIEYCEENNLEGEF